MATRLDRNRAISTTARTSNLEPGALPAGNKLVALEHQRRRSRAVDETQVSALAAEVEAAWNVHDMARFAACFAADADFVNVTRPFMPTSSARV
jgi:hypothetical protein